MNRSKTEWRWLWIPKRTETAYIPVAKRQGLLNVALPVSLSLSHVATGSKAYIRDRGTWDKAQNVESKHTPPKEKRAFVYSYAFRRSTASVTAVAHATDVIHRCQRTQREGERERKTGLCAPGVWRNLLVSASGGGGSTRSVQRTHQAFGFSFSVCACARWTSEHLAMSVPEVPGEPGRGWTEYPPSQQSLDHVSIDSPQCFTVIKYIQ